MKRVLGCIVGWTVWGAAGIALADPVHTGRGVIVTAGATRVTLVLEDRRRQTFEIAGTTEVFDDLGRPFPAAGLLPGDLVREDCAGLPDGRYLARRIKLLRPAWRALESPEQ